MSLRDDFPDLKFTESMLINGECPICLGRRELPSGTSPSGYMDCACKAVGEILSIFGPQMKGVEGKLSTSPLYKYHGKNLFIRGTSSVDNETSKLNLLSHIKYILVEEFKKYLLARGNRQFHPYPEWQWMQSPSVVDLYFQASKENPEALMELENLKHRLPWLVMEIGISAPGNSAFASVIPGFCRLRSDSSLATWVFTRRSDDYLRKVYGPEMLNWINEQDKT